MSGGERKRTPIPNRDIEAKSTGSGPVKSYFLSKEELASIVGKPIPEYEKKPIGFISDELEVMNMGQKEGPVCGLTREDVIKSVAAGETLSSIEKAWNMKYNTIHPWMKKWDLKGITPDKAQEMLEQMQPEQELFPDPPEDEVSSPGEVELIREKDAEIERLREELAIEVQEKHHYLSELNKAEEERDRLRKMLDESGQQRRNAAEAHAAVQTRLEEHIEHLKEQLQQTEINLVQATIEKEAAPKDQTHDPVNHPAHYTSGSVECIDAIEAATTGLSGGTAYNTGAAIKYLWRWHRKNGTEDLRKAVWYINRIIEGVNAE